MKLTFKQFLAEEFIFEDSLCYDEVIEEAEHEGKEVQLNRPFRTSGGPKKFSVYVKNDKGNVVKVNFGDPGLSIKRDDPERRKAFRARHNCADATDRTSPKYWSCKMWTRKPVSNIVESDKPWDKDVPSKGGKMTSAQRAEAKRRAKKAGRPYPNLVDNMAAMK